LHLGSTLKNQLKNLKIVFGRRLWTSQKELAFDSLGTIGCPQTPCQIFSGIQLKNVGKYVIDADSSEPLGNSVIRKFKGQV